MAQKSTGGTQSNQPQENDTSTSMHGSVKSPLIAKRMVELRKRHNLPQEKFAERIGVTKDTISPIERGAKGLTLAVALAIAKEFNESLDYICGISNVQNENARHILVSLREQFKIEVGPMSNKPYSNDDCLWISIDEDLHEFIYNMDIAEKSKLKANMSDRIYTEWIDEIERKYNEKIMSGKKGKTVRYKVVDPDAEKFLMFDHCPADCEHLAKYDMYK